MKKQNVTGHVRVKAIYNPKLSVYGQNPLIDALPPIMEVPDAIRKLSHFPNYDESMRRESNTVRYQYLKTCMRFFTPLGVHIDLEKRISSAIRMSYLERNPLEPEYITRIEESAEQFASGWVDQYDLQDNYVSTCAPGFNIVGISGCGKSQTTERILGFYPQVIDHDCYQGRKFTEAQIVWLKLDCPFDGSIKALCLNFFSKGRLSTRHELFEELRRQRLENGELDDPAYCDGRRQSSYRHTRHRRNTTTRFGIERRAKRYAQFFRSARQYDSRRGRLGRNI